MKKKIIILCQAPAQIQYVLSIYETYKDSALISIFCIDLESIYKFLSSLKLNLERLIYISGTLNFSFSNPIKIFFTKKEINYTYLKYFHNTSGCEIIYFSNRFDWFTFSLVEKLTNENKIYFWDYLEISENENIYDHGIKRKLQLTILYFITGIKYRYLKIDTKSQLDCPYKKYEIIKTKPHRVSEKIFIKYSYSILNNSKKSILFFENDMSGYNYIQDYKGKILEIFRYLKSKNYDVYIKPHPRLGYTVDLNSEFTSLIPSFIPAEFLKIDSFQMILGVLTASLTHFAVVGNKPTFSLMNLFKFKNRSTQRHYQDYLLKQSDNRLLFINSFGELERILLSRL